MSSTKICPKTCTQLSTAAIFISVGIIQFLAGIILLKSDYIYLLSGIDFITSVMNIIFGGSLGITSSVWEKKQHNQSVKSSARQNVLAGLYISIMVINATTVIIMIMGEGNKLLTVPEEVTRNASATFVVEILACAYVTSVCSPIVCIVIALVCLSGNRIKLQTENTTKKQSISSKESYGWVYEHGQGPKKISEVLYSPTRGSTSDDNVFLDKRTCSKKKILNKKLSRSSYSKSSVSLREIETPLEIWAQKRRKIMEEITAPKRTYSVDEYLQFPQFSYGTYAQTVLPRVKRLSLIDPLNRRNCLIPRVKSMGDIKSKINETSKPLQINETGDVPNHCDEVVTDLGNNLDQIESANQLDNVKIGIDDRVQRTVYNERLNFKSPISKHSVHMKNRCEKYQTLNKNLIKRISNEQVDSTSIQISENSTDDRFTSTEHGDLEIVDETELNLKQLSNSEPKLEAINVLKSKLERIDSDKKFIFNERREFLESFKKGKKEKAKCSESDIENRFSFAEQVSERSAFSEGSEDKLKSPWAGEVIPIKVLTSTSGTATVPIPNVCSRYSASKTSNESMNDAVDSPFSPSENHKYHKRTFSHHRSHKNRGKHIDSERMKNSSIKHLEKKRDIAQRITSMGSIAESLSEEINFNKSMCDFKELERDSVGRNAAAPTPPERKGSMLSNVLSKKNEIMKRSSTNILKRLWSLNRTEDKVNLTSLIMDKDSLVGLTEEDLKARTNRIRQLRQSVQLRNVTDSELPQDE